MVVLAALFEEAPLGIVDAVEAVDVEDVVAAVDVVLAGASLVMLKL